jgi:hypothetical protein
MVLYEIKNIKIQKYKKSVSIINTCICGVRCATYLCLPECECIVCDTQCLGLESRTHGVELPEDFCGSFLAQRRVCEHGDVGAF